MENILKLENKEVSMRQPLQGFMEDTFSAKSTNVDKGAVTSIKAGVKAAFGEVLSLDASWSSQVGKSQEEEEITYVQRSVVKGRVSFPRGSILRFDENDRAIYFEIVDMDFNKDKEKLKNLALSSDFLRD